MATVETNDSAARLRYAQNLRRPREDTGASRAQPPPESPAALPQDRASLFRFQRARAANASAAQRAREWAGGQVGQKVGMAAGSYVPVVGTVAGAVAGKFIGRAAGRNPLKAFIVAIILSFILFMLTYGWLFLLGFFVIMIANVGVGNIVQAAAVGGWRAVSSVFGW